MHRYIEINNTETTKKS